MGGCQRFAVLRFSPIFSCGFAVFADFLCGFEVFADFSCGFAVSLVACGLRFPTKNGAVFRFLAILSCGFAVFIVFKYSMSFKCHEKCRNVADTLRFFLFLSLQMTSLAKVTKSKLYCLVF